VTDAQTPTLAAVMHEGLRRLEAAGWDGRDASLEIEVLTRYVLGWDRGRLVEQHFARAPAGLATALRSLIDRRLRHEPIAYITGTREFWGRDFRVTPAVLIPRPETELIVEKGLELLRPSGRRWWVADAGTGSGCLAVTLACELPHAEIIATDVSQAALGVAASNVAEHGVSARVRLVRTSWLDALLGRFDAIVANPPYVALSERASLQKDVVDFEPLDALFAGDDGLDAIRALLGQAVSRLAPGGWLLMEFGFGQADDVRREVERTPGLTLLEIARDLQGYERTLIATTDGERPSR
jgi:release factor glutamine methyltransferase